MLTNPNPKISRDTWGWTAAASRCAQIFVDSQEKELDFYFAKLLGGVRMAMLNLAGVPLPLRRMTASAVPLGAYPSESFFSVAWTSRFYFSITLVWQTGHLEPAFVLGFIYFYVLS